MRGLFIIMLTATLFVGCQAPFFGPPQAERPEPDSSEARPGELGQAKSQPATDPAVRPRTFWIDSRQARDGTGPERAALSWTALRRRQDVRPGDTIVFLPGEYPHEMEIKAQGSESKPITFRSQKHLGARFKDRIKLRGSFLRLEGFDVESPNGYGVYVYGVGNQVSRCRISNTKESGVYIRGEAATVRDCVIEKPGTNGLAVAESMETRIEGNQILDVGRSGIFVYDDAHNVRIRKNRIAHSRPPLPGDVVSGHGIYAKGTSTGKIVIEENEFDGKLFNQCVSLRGPGVIRRNVIRGGGNIRNGIYLLDDTDKNPNAHVVIENNLVFDQGMAAIRIGKSCDNWTIEIRNNTLVGQTVGILLGGSPRTLVSIENNIVGVTGPMKDCERPECHPKGYVVRHYGSFEALHFSHNLFFNRYAEDTWSNLESLGDSAVFGDPGFPNKLVAPASFKVLRGSKGADRVLDRGKALDEITTDLEGRARPQGKAWDLGAYEEGESD